MSRNKSTTAHSKAINALSSARKHVRKYRFDLERANVPETQIFVTSEDPNHPQKNAHAALMDYYEEVNQVEYIVMFDDIWSEDITDAAGNELTVTVPKETTVTKTVTEKDVDDMVPNLNDIETKEETLSLERLGYLWGGREITVKAKVDSAYRKAGEQVETVRLWLPPLFIKAAYSQLNNCLSKVGLLAQTSAPIEKDPDPI